MACGRSSRSRDRPSWRRQGAEQLLKRRIIQGAAVRISPVLDERQKRPGPHRAKKACEGPEARSPDFARIAAAVELLPNGQLPGAEFGREPRSEERRVGK